jgi:hypothetical protein
MADPRAVNHHSRPPTPSRAASWCSRCCCSRWPPGS